MMGDGVRNQYQRAKMVVVINPSEGKPSGQVYPEFDSRHAVGSIWRRTRFRFTPMRGRDRCSAQVNARRLVLRRTGSVRGGDGGVRLGAPLGTGADRTRARGSIVAPAHVKLAFAATRTTRSMRRRFARRRVGRASGSCRYVRSTTRPSQMRQWARELLAGQRTAALNALRGHLAEIGVVARKARSMPMTSLRLAIDGLRRERPGPSSRLRPRGASSACRPD